MKTRILTANIAAFSILILLAFTVFNSGCSSGSSTNSTAPATTNQSTANTALPQISFTFTPSEITVGQTTTLKWSVTNATSVTIDQGIGKVAASGSKVIAPTTNSTFTLTAIAANHSFTSRATITVLPSGLPYINSFTATPKVISRGQSTVLQWDVGGANSIYIDQGILNVAESDSLIVAPAATTTYTLTATNNAGSIKSAVIVTVSSTALPVINNFIANPTTFSLGQTIRLSWDVTGASTVSLNQGLGTVPSTGFILVTPRLTTVYTLTAVNSAGSKSQSATVSLKTAALPTVNFSANATSIKFGQSVLLQWSTSNANSVAINPGSAVSTSGSLVVTPLTSTTYIITATNGINNANASVTIRVE
jgi:hypothetical protein